MDCDYTKSYPMKTLTLKTDCAHPPDLKTQKVRDKLR